MDSEKNWPDDRASRDEVLSMETHLSVAEGDGEEQKTREPGAPKESGRQPLYVGLAHLPITDFLLLVGDHLLLRRLHHRRPLVQKTLVRPLDSVIDELERQNLSLHPSLALLWVRSSVL